MTLIWYLFSLFVNVRRPVEIFAGLSVFILFFVLLLFLLWVFGFFGLFFFGFELGWRGLSRWRMWLGGDLMKR